MGKKEKRVAFILTEVIDRNIEIYCAACGVQKTALARHLFVSFLKEQGFRDPENKVEISCAPPADFK